MRQPRPGICLFSFPLRFVHDSQLTEEALLSWLGPENSGCYFTLKKAGLLVIVDDRVALSPDHLCPGARHFRYGHLVFWLDEDRVDAI